MPNDLTTQKGKVRQGKLLAVSSKSWTCLMKSIY